MALRVRKLFGTFEKRAPGPENFSGPSRNGPQGAWTAFGSAADHLPKLEGDIGVCGVAVLLSFLCGIPVNKIPHYGDAVISNPTVCDVCAFKPTVFGETKLFAVSRHQ